LNILPLETSGLRLSELFPVGFNVKQIAGTEGGPSPKVVHDLLSLITGAAFL